MIFLSRSESINRVTFYPDSASAYSANPSVRYELDWTSDYDKTSGSIDNGTLVNTPSNTDPRLVINFTGSLVPDYTGNYTMKLQEYLLDTGSVWSTQATIWSMTDFRWSDPAESGSKFTIDTVRAWVSGSDVPAFAQYADSTSQGQYSTYHI